MSMSAAPVASTLSPTPTPALVLCDLGDTRLPALESYSPFCLKVHRALRASGLAYETRRAANPGAYRRYNPVGQVPVLLVDGEPVTDSTRILARLSSLGGRSLLPEGDARAVAEAWLWEDLGDTTLNGFLVASRWADERNAPAVLDAYFRGAPWLVRRLVAPRARSRVLRALVARDVWRGGAEACWRRFDEVLDHLEARAPHAGFWVGPSLTVADLGLFAQLQAMRTSLTSPQRSAIEARPALRAYLDRVDARTGDRAVV